MIKCPVCGYENHDENMTCTYCGYKLMELQNQIPKPKNMIVSFILAVCLPGIAYFYLREYYRGILFILLYPIFLTIFSFVGGFYTVISFISVPFITRLILVVYFLLYLYQIYDMVQQTNAINKTIH